MTWHYPKGLSVHHFATFAVADDTSDQWLFMVEVLGDRGSASYNWHDSVFQRPLGTLPFAVLLTKTLTFTSTGRSPPL